MVEHQGTTPATDESLVRTWPASCSKPLLGVAPNWPAYKAGSSSEDNGMDQGGGIRTRDLLSPRQARY